jgi:hypothetical protein
MAVKKPPTTLPEDNEVSWPEEKQTASPQVEEEVEAAPTDSTLGQDTDRELGVESTEENTETNKQNMEPQQPQQNQPSSFGLEMKEQPRGGRNWVLTAGIILLVIALAGGGYFLYQNMNSSDSVDATPTESAFVVIASPAPSPSPDAMSPEIDRSEWSLEVLNGTGKSGLAAEVKTKLEDMGYTVSKVGNAAEADTTKILVNKKMADQQDALLADLKDEFNVETAGVLSDSSASARIIIGKDYLE